MTANERPARPLSDPLTIAGRIKALRQTLSMTQRELAHRLNVDQSLISRWEAGTTLPGDQPMRDLASLAGMPVAAFRYGGAPASENDSRFDGVKAGAWGRRITDHIEAAIRKADEAGRDDISAALSIILDKCKAEREAEMANGAGRPATPKARRRHRRKLGS